MTMWFDIERPAVCRYCQQPLNWTEHKFPDANSYHATCCKHDYAYIGTSLLVEKEEDDSDSDENGF